MSAPHRSSIYHKLSRFYDALFSPFFQARIHATIRKLRLPAGSKVLEVGVGTGLSLEAYPEHADVLGVDLSEDMLSHAAEKIDKNGYRHIKVRPMDALNLEFADDSFDYVMGFHIVSVVPDSARLMREMVRVCKPGGTVVVINHLRSERPLVALSVDMLRPITHLLGWHTKLRFEDVVGPVELQEVERYKTSPYSLFTIIVAKKPAVPQAKPTPESNTQRIPAGR
jgi:phosphatidylethanolamine/phosphatidyl-N-methylethanolamine N-methyltransferase